MNLLLGDWVEGERRRIVAPLCDWLRIPSISARPGRVHRFHAPNERMVMDQFWKGLLAAGELFNEVGDLGRH